MNSERQKREEEIARIIANSTARRNTDLGFQEEVRKAAAENINRETSRIEKTERAEGRKLTINVKTAGVALLIVGAGVSLFMPGVGAVLLLGTIAGIAWISLTKRRQK